MSGEFTDLLRGAALVCESNLVAVVLSAIVIAIIALLVA